MVFPDLEKVATDMTATVRNLLSVQKFFIVIHGHLNQVYEGFPENQTRTTITKNVFLI